MPNQVFNEPHQPNVFDRKVKVAGQSQPVAVANAGRTHWLVQMRAKAEGATLDVSWANDRGDGAGSYRLDQDCKSIDSALVPEITQAAVFVCGNIADMEFTFEEVAAVRSAQA